MYQLTYLSHPLIPYLCTYLDWYSFPWDCLISLCSCCFSVSLPQMALLLDCEIEYGSWAQTVSLKLPALLDTVSLLHITSALSGWCCYVNSAGVSLESQNKLISVKCTLMRFFVLVLALSFNSFFKSVGHHALEENRLSMYLVVLRAAGFN